MVFAVLNFILLHDILSLLKKHGFGPLLSKASHQMSQSNASSDKPFKQDSFSCINLNEADQYHLSLSLEILKGCQFNCKGCHVNKDGGSPITAEQIMQLGHWLDSMQHSANYLPTLVFIAPTDFLTASNTLQILQNPELIAFLGRFRRLSLQTTYLDISRIQEIASVLRKNYSHMELELNFVIEPEHLENDKYLQRIITNRNKVYEALQWRRPVLSFCILNVYEYDRIKKSNVRKILHDYKALHDKIKALFGTTIDFNFSMTRNSWWSNKDVEEAVRSVSRIFDEGLDSEFAASLRFSFGSLQDSRIEKHYNWHAGNIYLSPMIYERIASFHPLLQIPMAQLSDFSVEVTEAFEDASLLRQYNSASTKADCSECEFLGSCIERGVITFMDMYEIDRCIIAKRAVKKLNTPI